ncbi:MAG TPA: type VI secretion system tip protein VgrG [Bacteroidia bacterium]|nr:type VI secretion system tip protein VgrG [Bacteroidia bacterium]
MSDVLIPNTSKHDVTSFTILVDEKEVNPSYQVLSVSISKEINRIPVAQIILRDGEAADRTFAISETNDFIPGKKIKINVGRDGNNEQFFKGIIIRHAIRVKENGNGELHVECRDQAVKMTIGRHSRYFENVKDSEVFDQLCKYKDLSSDAEQTVLKHKELVQHHISDWDFMLLRAEANAMLVNVNDGVIKISKPDTSSSPVMQVTYGSTIYEFEAEIDARQQFLNVEAKSWDYSNQELFTTETSSAGFTEHGNIPGSDIARAINPDKKKFELHHSGHRIEQEIKDFTDGIMLRSRLAKIRGRAKFQGFGGVKVGDMVKIDGVGARFNGKAFVTAVKHDLSKGMWDTHIQFGLDPQRYAESHDDDMNDRQTAGLVGAIHGLQIGKTVQLQSDPDGEDRILVKIPVIDNAAQGIWTRVASLDAGNGRGAFFRPEIGDEVIVGFINDDPRDAVLLGMLHSSANPAPIKAEDANNEKGFTTRSKMHISFNDDTKTITIDTPAGNSITLDEQGTKIEIKDQNSNKITMDTAGIKVDSPKNVEINAGVNLTLKAAASLTIGAATISIKADGNVSVEGAMAKLAGQGMTEITGGIVKIN